MNLDCPSCGRTLRLPEGALGEKGRKLRCGVCKHVWFQEPAGDSPEARPDAVAAAPAPPPEPVPPTAPPASDAEAATGPDPASGPSSDASDEAAPEPERAPSPPDGESDGSDESDAPSDEAAPAAPPPVRGPGVAGLFAPLLLLAAAGALFCAYYWRGPIVCEAPWAAEAYDAVGLVSPPTPLGLEIVETALSLEEGDDGRPLLVVTGRIVNAGAELVRPPRLRAEVFAEGSRPLHDWTFAAPPAVLCPGGAAPFRAASPDPPGEDGELRHSVTFADAR